MKGLPLKPVVFGVVFSVVFSNDAQVRILTRKTTFRRTKELPLCSRTCALSFIFLIEAFTLGFYRGAACIMIAEGGL